MAPGFTPLNRDRGGPAEGYPQGPKRSWSTWGNGFAARSPQSAPLRAVAGSRPTDSVHLSHIILRGCAGEALEWIITKALTKDREERYQTAKELLTDLKRLQQRLDVARRERSLSRDRPSTDAAAAGGNARVETAMGPAVDTSAAGAAQPTSSAGRFSTARRRAPSSPINTSSPAPL
jgi:hypothetical protein